MTVGIVGLGLIGGSMAKAYHEAGHTVWGLDQNQVTQEFAALSGCIDGALTEEKISTCDLILLAAYPAGLLHKKLRQCDGDMEEHQNPSVTAIPSSVPVYRRICQLLC